MLVSIVTPTTGNPWLQQAIQSIQDQDYNQIEHLIVIDGKEREEKAQKILSEMQLIKPTHIMCLPYATGKDRYNGHRIYGSSCYIANGDYIIFLDEDNWFEPFHVSSLVELIQQNKLDWAYALRNIVDEQGQFIAHDDCESLGKYPVYNQQYHHVDTSCYCLKKEIAVTLSPIWYRKFREPGLMSPDIALCNVLVQDFPNCDTTGMYSVNYRIGSTPLSVQPEFFLYGNSLMAAKYPDGFPWRKASSPLAFNNTVLDNLNLREINLIAFPAWSHQEVGKIQETLAESLKLIQSQSEVSKITLLLYAPAALEEQANTLLWDFLVDYLDESLADTEVPEVAIVSDMSATQWQSLLSMLTGYISLENEDSEAVLRLVQERIPQYAQ